MIFVMTAVCLLLATCLLQFQTQLTADMTLLMQYKVARYFKEFVLYTRIAKVIQASDFKYKTKYSSRVLKAIALLLSTLLPQNAFTKNEQAFAITTQRNRVLLQCGLLCSVSAYYISPIHIGWLLFMTCALMKGVPLTSKCGLINSSPSPPSFFLPDYCLGLTL